MFVVGVPLAMWIDRGDSWRSCGSWPTWISAFGTKGGKWSCGCGRKAARLDEGRRHDAARRGHRLLAACVPGWRWQAVKIRTVTRRCAPPRKCCVPGRICRGTIRNGLPFDAIERASPTRTTSTASPAGLPKRRPARESDERHSDRRCSGASCRCWRGLVLGALLVAVMWLLVWAAAPPGSQRFTEGRAIDRAEVGPERMEDLPMSIPPTDQDLLAAARACYEAGRLRHGDHLRVRVSADGT